MTLWVLHATAHDKELKIQGQNNHSDHNEEPHLVASDILKYHTPHM